MHRVIEVEPVRDYILRLRFSDSQEKLINVEPYIGNGIGSALGDRDFFNRVSIDSAGGIVWPNGYDFCPNYLYDDVPAIESVTS